MSIPTRNSTLRRFYTQPYQQNKAFDWDKLMHQPISSYLTDAEVQYIDSIAVSAKYGGIGVKRKTEMVNEILKPKGFIFMVSGTNRLVYRCDYDQSFVLKIGFDRVGVEDSKKEYLHQQLLKPFVPKIFDVSPGGAIGLIERVERIRNRHEFMNVADQIFDVLNQRILGKYVLEDIGTNFFKNWGLRDGFGPVLLDFPYLYEIDGSKLVCNAEISNGVYCDGYIDYDSGFNYLVCEKCGQRHSARSLSKANGASMVTPLSAKTGRRSKMFNNGVMTLIVNGKEYGAKTKQDEEQNDVVVKNRPNYWNGYGLKNVLVIKKSDGTKEIKGNIPNNAPPSMVLHDGFFVDKERLNRKKTREDFRSRREEQGKKYSFDEPRVSKKEKIKYSRPILPSYEAPKVTTKETSQVDMVVKDEIPYSSPTIPSSTKFQTSNLTDTEKDRLTIGYQGQKHDTKPEIILEPEVIVSKVAEPTEEERRMKEEAIEAQFEEKVSKPVIPKEEVEEEKPKPEINLDINENETIVNNEDQIDLVNLMGDLAKDFIRCGTDLYIKFEVIKGVIPFDENTVNVIEHAATEVEINFLSTPKEEKAAETITVEEQAPTNSDDLSSAADRTKLNEVLMDETEIFLESIGEDDIKNIGQKEELESYLNKQLALRYNKSDKEMLKQIVKNFVNGFYDDSVLKETEKTQKERKAENRRNRSIEARKKARMQF